MGLTSALVDLAVRTIDMLGYPGIFVLMTLESMVAPVPSEAVMPFAGFLIAQGKMSFWTVVAVSTAASLFGSYLSYEIGKHLGRPFVDRWGKWLLVSSADLDRTDSFFRRRGAWAVFVCRFVPVVRHLISLPAGVARMRMGTFLLATGAGALCWNAFLAWVGMQLGEHWERVHAWLEPFDYAIVALLLVAVVGFIVLHVRRARREHSGVGFPR